jgi:indolepyruvate decarboxylase
VAFTVADYVLKRLSEQHVDTLFGVPAAYCARCSMLRERTV